MTALVGTASAGPDLQLSIAAQAEYDPNVGRDKADIHSAVFRIVPKIHVVEDTGNLEYDISYLPYYQYSTAKAGINGFQHYLNAAGRYLLGDRTEFFLMDNFSYAESVDTVNNIDEEGVLSIGTRNKPVTRNRLRGGVQHMFTPRLSSYMGVGWKLFNADIFNRAESNSYTGNIGVQYVLDPVHTISLGVAADYQKFEKSNGGLRPPEETLFVNIYGGWTWAISEKTSFEFAVGPTFIDSRQKLAKTRQVPVFALTGSDSSGGNGFDAETCPPAPPPPVGAGEFAGFGCEAVSLDPAQFQAANAFSSVTVPVIDEFSSGSSTSWTAFGSLLLNHRWRPDLVSSLSYQRTASTSSGLGSSVLDDIFLVTSWDISELWDANMRIGFTIRESTSPTKEYIPIVTNQSVTAPGTSCADPGPTCLASFQGNAFRTALINQDINTIRWGASARVARTISEHFQVSLRYNYTSQTSEANTLGLSSDFDDHLITVAVQYNFDRWNLW